MSGNPTTQEQGAFDVNQPLFSDKTQKGSVSTRRTYHSEIQKERLIFEPRRHPRAWAELVTKGFDAERVFRTHEDTQTRRCSQSSIIGITPTVGAGQLFDSI